MISQRKKQQTLSIPARFDQLEQLAVALEAFLQQAKGLPEPESDIYGIKLAVHELITNVIDHAYAGVSDGKIDIELTLKAREVCIDIEDAGVSFDPDGVDAPDLDNGQVRGYGMFLIEQLMDEVQYTSIPDGNRWRLIKRW